MRITRHYLREQHGPPDARPAVSCAASLVGGMARAVLNWFWCLMRELMHIIQYVDGGEIDSSSNKAMYVNVQVKTWSQ